MVIELESGRTKIQIQAALEPEIFRDWIISLVKGGAGRGKNSFSRSPG